MNQNRDIAFCLLSGGKSSRFKKDKATELLKNKRLIDYSIDLLLKYTDTIYISCPYLKDKYRITDDPTGFKIKKIRDKKPFLGPLCGIYYVMEETNHEYYLFLGVDMPFLTKKMIDILISSAQNNVFASVFAYNNKITPLPIMISKNYAMEFFKKNKCDNKGIKDILSYKQPHIENWGNYNNLININTQDDFKEALLQL